VTVWATVTVEGCPQLAAGKLLADGSGVEEINERLLIEFGSLDDRGCIAARDLRRGILYRIAKKNDEIGMHLSDDSANAPMIPVGKTHPPASYTHIRTAAPCTRRSGRTSMA
jgi:hypothetical protein